MVSGIPLVLGVGTITSVNVVFGAPKSEMGRYCMGGHYGEQGRDWTEWT